MNTNQFTIDLLNEQMIQNAEQCMKLSDDRIMQHHFESIMRSAIAFRSEDQIKRMEHEQGLSESAA